MTDQSGVFDCEFSLALNNRTGKYFFCKDMIEASGSLIRTVYYWRVPRDTLPPRLSSRILGRLARIEIDWRAGNSFLRNLLPKKVHASPMVFTDPRECLLYRLKSSDVVVCHDMGPLTHPEFYGAGVAQVYSQAFCQIKKAKPSVLFVSDASRKEFVRLCGNDFPSLDVVYPPLRQGIADGDQEAVEGLMPQFFLTVGSVGTRKNQLRTLQAFAASNLAQRGFGYVICGGPEPGSNEVIALAEKTPGTTLLGYVSDQQLRWLYQNAKGFLLPSLLEGFGLPAAEAIAHGLIPLLSSGGALEEVAGDGAIYVDPHSIPQIIRGLHTLASMSQGEREGRLSKMRQSIARFSLEQASNAWCAALRLAASRS